MGNVLTNDSDKDGDTLTVSAVNGLGGAVGNSVAGTYGHITINSDGTYSYLADNTAIDSAPTGSHLTDVFSYTASDGFGGTTTTNITVTVDRAPTAVADNPATDAVESGAGLVGNVLTNDSDRDGDALTVSAVNGVARQCRQFDRRHLWPHHDQFRRQLQLHGRQDCGDRRSGDRLAPDGHVHLHGERRARRHDFDQHHRHA